MHQHNYRLIGRKVSLTTNLSFYNNKYWLDFNVRDNGGGLALHQLKQIFQPGISFAREKDERHGLGLWLARYLARQVGGDILISENIRGLGVCFVLRIPLVLG